MKANELKVGDVVYEATGTYRGFDERFLGYFGTEAEARQAVEDEKFERDPEGHKRNPDRFGGYIRKVTVASVGEDGTVETVS